MRDLNFFEDYIEKSEFSLDRQLVYFILSMIIVIILMIFILFNQIKIRQLSKSVNKLQTIVEDERIIKKVKEINEKQEELNAFNKSVEQIRVLDNRIEEDSVVDNNILDTISLKMPEDVFVTSISVRTTGIQLVGNSKDRWSIAQYAKNLATVEDFHQVFISNISSQDSYYNFILNISLEDVIMDDEESIEEETEDQETD